MTREEYEQKEQRIRDLVCDLQSAVSTIGDWKAVKYQEYAAQGLDAPYTDDEMAEYYTARQAARDEINELQAELDTAVIEDGE